MNKRNIKFLLMAGAFLFSVFVMGFSDPSITLNSLQTDFRTDSIAPFGAYPEQQFKTHIFFDNDSSSYVFEYQGEQIVTYRLDLNDMSTQGGLIKIGVTVNDSDVVFPVVEGGTRYKTKDGRILEPGEYAKLSKVKMLNHNLENNTLHLTYEETYEGVSNYKSIEYTLQGKTIVVHLTSKNSNGTGNYYGFSFGQSQNTLKARIVEIPYAIDPIVIFNDQLFYSVYLDRGKSSSIYFDKVENSISDDSIQAYFRSQSCPDSNGKIAPLGETAYITVSGEIHDVLPKINNPYSPYRNQISNKVVMDIWQANPSDYGSQNSLSTYAASKKMLDYFHEFGFTNLIILYHDWQRYGYDTKLPVHYPANPTYGTEEEFKQFINTAKDLGYLIALHENYSDMYPNSPSYDQADLARNSDLSLKTGWFNSVQAYLIAGDKTQKYADQEGQQIAKNYAPNATFLDVLPSISPTFDLDFNVQNPTIKSYSSAEANMKNLFLHQKTLYKGPLFGEGRAGSDEYDSFYAGYVDGVEREIYGNYLAKIIPDFELLAVKPLMANQGMGYYGRYFVPPNTDQQTLSPGQVNWDLYRASEIAYGHTGFISNATLTNSFPKGTLEEAFTEYYMLQQLQDQYLSSPVTSIQYEDNGKFVFLSQAIIDNIDFKNPHLFVQYKNGLNIYLNMNRGSFSNTASLDFGVSQGGNGWTYEYWNGNKYLPLKYTSDHWQGNLEWCRLWPGGGHPSLSCEPTLEWLSLQNMDINVSGITYDMDPNCGNGVAAEIYKNSEKIWSTNIKNGDTKGTQFNIDLSVEKDDKIFFRINPLGDQDCDSTYFNPIIKYSVENTPWVVDADGKNYTLPPLGWVAWNHDLTFVEYSSLLEGERIDYSDTPQYTFARSRQGLIQSIGKITTDGTVAIHKSYITNNFDIHMVNTSIISYGSPEREIINTSAKCDLNLKYHDKDQIFIGIHHVVDGKPIRLTYLDLPEDWFDDNHQLQQDNSIQVWQNNSAGEYMGGPIKWHVDASGLGLVIENLNQDQSYIVEHVTNIVTPPTPTIQNGVDVSNSSKSNSPRYSIFFILAGALLFLFLIGYFLRFKIRK